MKPLILAALAFGLSAPAVAQQHDHAAMAKPAAGIPVSTQKSPTPRDPAATREMAAINARMHGAMNVAVTGDLDADFVRGMIPHHQGAIDMAELQLKHSKDPQIRTLARSIVGAQRREITFMRSWLRERGISEK